jgi:FkbM family methyltransferase
MRFSLPWRLPIRLRGESVGAQLLRHGWYVAPPPLFVPDLYRRLSEADPFADVLEVAGQEVPVDMRNSQFIAADRVSFPDGYEPDVAAAIELLLPDDGVFIDAGANWGCFALLAALRPGFHGQVIAVEPAPRPADDLAGLIAALGLPIQALRLALGEADGEALLSQPLMTGGASLVEPGAGTPVTVRRLDGLGLPDPHVIKLDVEGAELAALRGAAAILARHRPAIVMECRTDTPGGDWAAPLHLLAGHGYRLFALAAAVDQTAGRSALTLTAMTPATRGEFPLHLNILAVADPDSLARHPDRTA